ERISFRLFFPRDLRANRAWAGAREPFLLNPDLRRRTVPEYLPFAPGFRSGAVLSLFFALPGPFHELVYLKSVEKSSAYKRPFPAKKLNIRTFEAYHAAARLIDRPPFFQ